MSGGCISEAKVKFVLQWNKPVATASAIWIAGSGHLAGNPIATGNSVLINVEGAHDTQTIVVRVDVTDLYGGVASFTLPVGLRQGDVDGNGTVDNADITAAQSAIGTVDANNFRFDVNVGGEINNGDVSIIQSQRRNSGR